MGEPHQTASDDRGVLVEKIRELEEKLQEQTDSNNELKRTKQALSEEIMELTKALFEEANGMVATEAKARANLEATRLRLEGDLETTKQQLLLEKQQLFELRQKIHTVKGEHGLGAHQEVSPQRHSWARKKKYDYFGCLLPTLRVETRKRINDEHTGKLWERLCDRMENDEYREFVRFVEHCSALKNTSDLMTSTFMRRVLEKDIFPSLDFHFKPSQFVKQTINSMLCNTCTIEKILPDDDANAEDAAGGTFGVAHVCLAKALEAAEGEEIHGDPLPAQPAEGIISEEESPKSKASSSANPTTARIRGLMNHFTTSVSSLPETLLANMSQLSATAPTNSVHTAPSFCPLCGNKKGSLEYRFRLRDGDPWMLVDRWCGERLIAVGHLLTFVRHVKGGFFGNRPLLDLYFDQLHYRRLLFYTRLDPNAMAFFIQSDLDTILEQP